MDQHEAERKKFIDGLPWPIKPSKLKIGREINRGAYGVVYEGTFSDQPVAIKCVHKLLLEAEGGENALRSFSQECRRLQELDHPHVISESSYDTEARAVILHGYIRI